MVTVLDDGRFLAALNQARQIKLLLTDVDGVLTDSCVYYSDRGEELKRFSVRDGMGVERLRDLAQVEVGIITGERSGSVLKRAEKLQIVELHLGIKHKLPVLQEICRRRELRPSQIAYIGDDTNDLEVLRAVGLSAAPADAISFVREAVTYLCTQPGGRGAFREFAELIIAAQRAAAFKEEKFSYVWFSGENR